VRVREGTGSASDQIKHSPRKRDFPSRQVRLPVVTSLQIP